MQEVKLVVNGKEYAKTYPMIADWNARMKLTRDLQGKNVNDEGVMEAIADVVAGFLGAPPESVQKFCTLPEISATFKAIDANIWEATHQITGKNAEGPARPKNK